MIDRDNDLHPLFYRRGLLMSANGGAVDHLDFAIVRGGDGVHQPVPYACLPPSIEAVVTGCARAVALWQVAPRRTGSQHPEDAVQHAPVIDARHASRLVGQQRLDHAPLEVGQVISAHADAESEFNAIAKPCLTSKALAEVAAHSQCHGMSKLYPARRIAQWWLGLWLIALVAAVGIAIAHFGFGVDVYDEDTRQPATSTSIATGTFFIGVIGAAFASAGALILRAARRHHGG